MSTQYFAEQPEAAHRPGVVHVVLPDVHLALATDAGVFSPGRLDPGTRVLLDTAPPPPAEGNLLDLGCGYGPLALVLASRAPGASVWATDVNTRALHLCSINKDSAGLSNVRCVPPDSAELPARFALIWSNPPIRIGKAGLHALLERWLSRLTDDGSAVLVVQKHLGADSLQRWLEEQGYESQRLASKAGFRLLRVPALAGVSDHGL